MLADSRRSHPLAFFLRLEIAEQLDASRLRVAIEQASRFHPLLAATVHRYRGRWMWHLAGPPPSLTIHPSNAYVQSCDDWTFDMHNESGVRLSLSDAALPQAARRSTVGISQPPASQHPASQHPNTQHANTQHANTELWLQVHHCCSDARGVLRFLDDVQHAYHQPLTESQIRPREQAAQRQLASRATGFDLRLQSYLNPLGPKWNRIWKYFGHRTRPLAPSTTATSDRSFDTVGFSPTYVSRRLPFDSDAWRRRRAEEHPNATLNDCLLRSLFTAMATHHSQASHVNDNPWLRIGVPIDMRSRADIPSCACNCSSLVFLDRRLRTIHGQPDLLDDIHAEMGTVKQHRLGSVFFDCLAAAHGLPMGMRLAVNDRRCAVSAVASNLGAISLSPVPGFTIRSIDFLPPLRPGTRLAVGLSTYNNELSLAMHYDQRLISATDAEGLLECLSSEMN